MVAAAAGRDARSGGLFSLSLSLSSPDGLRLRRSRATGAFTGPVFRLPATRGGIRKCVAYTKEKRGKEGVVSGRQLCCKEINQCRRRARGGKPQVLHSRRIWTSVACTSARSSSLAVSFRGASDLPNIVPNVE